MGNIMDVKIMFSSAGTKSKERTPTNYNALPVPKGYVAGLGRGVTGFVTRSDIGPGTYTIEEDNKEVTEEKFDEFMGNDAGMFAYSGIYEDDDREADAVWDAVEEFIDQRRREKREKQNQEKIKKCDINNIKIADSFSSLKRKLSEIAFEQWEAIPDIGVRTNKQKMSE